MTFDEILIQVLTLRRRGGGPTASEGVHQSDVV